jgi:hypothetical protein
MSKVSRGGLTLKTGKIGRVNCLRQQILMPGEMMNVSVQGNVRLESLRERDVMRINAHLACFMTPLRWLWPEYPDYLREGPETSETPPSMIPSDDDWSKYGVGTYEVGLGVKDLLEYFPDNYLRVYNEWYKFPGAPDATDNDIPVDGLKAVPLAKPWSRCRYTAGPYDSENYEVDSATEFDVRELAQIQAKFRSAIKRDVISYNRWSELVKEAYNGDGSREVDQVPLMLDQVEVGVTPRDLPATDGASLGQWQSLYDFNVDHQIKGIVAPEHCIVSWFLVVRFPSITAGHSPLATDSIDWETLTADPEYLSSAMPKEVQVRDLLAPDTSTVLGYLPAGWEWRCDHDVIGKAIYDRNSFPFMENPTTATEAKDATRIKNAFRSAALGDYMVDVYFKEESRQPIGTAMDSYFSGMVEEAKNVQNSNDEFPKGGKQL